MTPQQPRQQRNTIAILAVTQVLSWGSIYYAISVLAPEIQRELGWRSDLVYGAFSWSLLIAGLCATHIGAWLDRVGGRAVMGAGSLLAGAGLIVLSRTHTLFLYWLAWSMLGLAMAMVLYEAAFAAINREFGYAARGIISKVTLLGGFASTVFWPLTLKLNGLIGWRDTYLLYGLVQLFLCAPLHGLLGVRTRAPSDKTVHGERATPGYTLAQAVAHPVFWRLAAAFAANSLVGSALAVHLIPLLHKLGHPVAAIVVFAALFGPMQVLGRIGEMLFASSVRPQSVGMLAFGALPAALLALILAGERQWAVAAFCLLYGLSNGILTIVRGTVPQALFGREHYGAISGALAGPSLVARAAGPLAVAALIQAQPSVTVVLGVLLAVSVGSLLCYLNAVRIEAPAPVPAL
ncbi:MAG: MFS transporter [Burkholderiaceae bacterium]|nr:MFS transporter [Burkholderiaceae bacterium]